MKCVDFQWTEQTNMTIMLTTLIFLAVVQQGGTYRFFVLFDNLLSIPYSSVSQDCIITLLHQLVDYILFFVKSRPIVIYTRSWKYSIQHFINPNVQYFKHLHRHRKKVIKHPHCLRCPAVAKKIPTTPVWEKPYCRLGNQVKTLNSWATSPRKLEKRELSLCKTTYEFFKGTE